ncbi:FAD-binding protein, partial [Acidithiobacillus ferrivorans]|nr:FAD-binding protein [Acidithiobacillus ferrivorans]
MSNAFLAELRAALSAEAVLSSAEELRPYECDGLSVLRELPLCVVLPTDREGVQAVLHLCQRYGVAVVPRGAGTGLSGGARPIRGAVLL